MTALLLEIPTGTEIIVNEKRHCTYLRPLDDDNTLIVNEHGKIEQIDSDSFRVK